MVQHVRRTVGDGQAILGFVVMGGGPSGLMYILRARALEVERGDSPDLSAIYAPGTLRQARRRLIAVWALSVAWIPGLIAGGLIAVMTLAAAFLGLVLAVSTQFEAAWIGSPIRRWTRYAIPVTLSGFVLAVVVL
jgi:hypothetical protein